MLFNKHRTKPSFETDGRARETTGEYKLWTYSWSKESKRKSVFSSLIKFIDIFIHVHSKVFGRRK